MPDDRAGGDRRAARESRGRRGRRGAVRSRFERGRRPRCRMEVAARCVPRWGRQAPWRRPRPSTGSSSSPGFSPFQPRANMLSWCCSRCSSFALTCGTLGDARDSARCLPLDPASPRATAAVVRHQLETNRRARDFARARVDPDGRDRASAHVGSRASSSGRRPSRVGVLLPGWSRHTARTRLSRPRSRDVGLGSTRRDLSTSVLRAITQFGSTTASVLVGGRRRADRVPAHADARARCSCSSCSWSRARTCSPTSSRCSSTGLVPTSILSPGCSGASFPSGHSAAAAATYAVCVLLIRSRRVTVGPRPGSAGVAVAIRRWLSPRPCCSVCTGSPM